MRAKGVVIMLVVALAVVGCASVKVQSVKELSAYNKAKAAKSSIKTPKPIDGLRYYMPRPYLAVNEPFIVDSDAYLVGGEVSPDGSYVLLNDVKGDLDGHFQAASGGQKRIEADRVIPLEEGAVGGAPHAFIPDALKQEVTKKAGEWAKKKMGEALAKTKAGTDTKTKQETEAKKGEGKEVKEEAGKDAGSKPEEKTGILNAKVTNDNSAFAMTPLKRYFDIVYLPDFEREMVIKGHAGLGNASILMQMGQAWSLQGLDAKADNSEISKRILAAIDSGMDVLSTVARAQLGLPPVVTGTPHAKLPNGKAAEPLRFAGGTSVTVKVTVVRIVPPGLYPILKPEECAKLKRDTEKKDNCYVLAIPELANTNIAFRTYEAVVVEAAKPTGDTALRIHQYIDAGTPPTTSGQAVQPGTDNPQDHAGTGGVALTEIQTQCDAALSKGAQGAKWTVKDLPGRTGDKYTIKIEKFGGEPAMTLDQAKEAVKKACEGLGIQPSNVQVES
jgi:hypothetical protein